MTLTFIMYFKFFKSIIFLMSAFFSITLNQKTFATYQAWEDSLVKGDKSYRDRGSYYEQRLIEIQQLQAMREINQSLNHQTQSINLQFEAWKDEKEAINTSIQNMKTQISKLDEDFIKLASTSEPIIKAKEKENCEKEQKIKNEILNVAINDTESSTPTTEKLSIKSDEDGGSLISKLKNLRKINFQLQEEVNYVRNDPDKTSQILKQIMEKVGIEIEDIKTFTGSHLAKKCLEKLEEEME